MKISTIFLSTLSLCAATPTLTKELVENEIENKDATFGSRVPYGSTAGAHPVQSQYTLGNPQYQQPQNQYVPNANTQSQQYNNNGQYSQSSCSASQCSNHEQRLLLLEANHLAVVQAFNQLLSQVVS